MPLCSLSGGGRQVLHHHHHHHHHHRHHPSGRGILLKPAPGAKEADEEEKDVEKGGRVVKSGKVVKKQEDLDKGKTNSSSPPLLPLLAAPRDLRLDIFCPHRHFLVLRKENTYSSLPHLPPNLAANCVQFSGFLYLCKVQHRSYQMSMILVLIEPDL